MLYFISIRALIENFHKKSYLKSYGYIMPSYFYKAIKGKTEKPSVK